LLNNNPQKTVKTTSIFL